MDDLVNVLGDGEGEMYWVASVWLKTRPDGEVDFEWSSDDIGEGEGEEWLGQFVDDNVDAPAVVRQLREFHAEAVRRLAGAGRVPWEGDTFYVLKDGRWHPDLIQLALRFERKPSLPPAEWLAQLIEIAASL